MSCVYFHSESGEATLRGSERAHCNVTTSKIALALLNLHEFGDDPIKFLLPQDHYSLHTGHFIQSVSTAFSIGDLRFELPDGRKTDSFIVALNTILAAGGDVLRLMARLHGQCEVHGYIEGPNRAWLADLIDKGIGECLLRPNMGWEAVTELLRKSDYEPIVTSYSVCDGFPSPYFCLPERTTTELEYESWYTLPNEEKWRQGMEKLRSLSESLLEFRPDNWSEVRFDEGITAMDIRMLADSIVKDEQLARLNRGEK